MTHTLSSRVAAIALVTLFFWTCPTGAVGQGYKSGTRNSPINEGGVKACDYWDQYHHTDGAGNRTVTHSDGTVVVKAPNRPPVVTRPLRSSEGVQLEREVWLVGKRFRDDKDGSMLTFGVWDIVWPTVTMYGQWTLPSGMQGHITLACFEPEENQGNDRILLWFMYPHTQAYGSAVLYPSADGMRLNGTYVYGGEVGRWDLTYLGQ